MLRIDLTFSVNDYSMPLMQIVAIDRHCVSQCAFCALVNGQSDHTLGLAVDAFM